MALAEKYNLLVVEDAAHCVDSFYKDKPLGGIGHLGAFSFHETKNISSGEGGTLNSRTYSHSTVTERDRRKSIWHCQLPTKTPKIEEGL